MERVPERPDAVQPRLPIAVLAVLVLASVPACIHDTAEPGLFSGPSELGLALALTASPDRLPLDGVSQSVVGIHARDENGDNVANLRLSLQISTSRGFEDFGRLSSRSVITGGDGRAAVIYTVPGGSPNRAGSEDTGSTVQIWATPVGTNAASAIGRTVEIRLVPSGTVIPPFDVVVGFTFTPDNPAVLDQIRFTTQCADANDPNCVRDPGSVVTSYNWLFGDGDTASGPEVTHLYGRAGTYVATLMVGDDFNRVAQATRSVTIGDTTAPTAAFESSPTDPVVGETVFFNASASTAAPGRVIEKYEWDFGDGVTDDDIADSHVYETTGTFVVVLRVTDDAGQTGTVSKSITVESNNPTADFDFAPTMPTEDLPVTFDASVSEAGKGRTITGYSWDFGDGDTSSSGPVESHTFEDPGTYLVRLTITDDVGKTDTAFQEVTVS